MNRFLHYRETCTLIKCVTVLAALTYGDTSIIEAIAHLIYHS